MKEVFEAYNIPRTSLKDHYEEKISGRKMDPKAIFTREDDNNLVEYMMKMVKLAHPLSVSDLKMTVAEIYKQRPTPFKDGIPRRSWLKWFKYRHPQLVMKVPQGVDLNKTKNLCSPMVQSFYENLQHLYN